MSAVRIVRLIGWAIASTVLMSACDAASPRGTPAPTSTAPSSTSVAPKSTEVAGTPTTFSPFAVSGPNGKPESLAGPALDDVPPQTDLAAVQRQQPSFRLLAESDRARFQLTAVESRQASGAFAWATYYVDGATRQLIQVGAWTKVGDFNKVVVLNSPVTDVQLTTIDGLHALTIMPSRNVAGGLGPRTAYFYRAGVIYVLHAEGFASDSDFLLVVRNFIAEVTK